MISALLLASALVAADASGPAPDVRAAYEEARAKAGRDPDAHVRLALWCERHGLDAERTKHLALAVLNDPKNALARGLLGFVRDRGAWRRPEDVSAKLEADAEHAAARAEYEGRRGRTTNTADAQWKLALWCEENGLRAEAKAHLAAVVRLDPGREAAWKRLGCKRQGSRWVTEAQLAAEKEERALQEKADRLWKPRLEKWRSWLDRKGPQREEAERALAEITDPRAVPMVLATFAGGGPERQATAVRVLGQIDSAQASRALALLAVFGKSAEVRRVATETLRRRDPREYAGMLIALLRDPITYDVTTAGGSGSPGVLRIDRGRYNVQRHYVVPPLTRQYRMFTDDVPFDPFSPQNIYGAMEGMTVARGSLAQGFIVRSDFRKLVNAHSNPNAVVLAFTDVGRIRDLQIGMNLLEARKAAIASQAQLADDVGRIESERQDILRGNALVFAVLNEGTGVNLPPDRGAWTEWLTNQFGYASNSSADAESKPTYVEVVTPAYQPQYNPGTSQSFILKLMSCFGAGTPVRTLEGSAVIEALRPGDVVLTQDLKTGALGYNPILAVHHNPPSRTFRVALAGETIVSSEFHRFWKAGHGWVMARDLKPGDAIRTLGGVFPVSSIDDGPVQPVYNLDVAEDADFFVGRGGVLVHDNTLPDLRLAPFDAVPEFAADARAVAGVP